MHANLSIVSDISIFESYPTACVGKDLVYTMNNRDPVLWRLELLSGKQGNLQVNKYKYYHQAHISTVGRSIRDAISWLTVAASIEDKSQMLTSSR